MPVTIQGNKLRLTSDYLDHYEDQITEAAQNHIMHHYKTAITLYWIPDIELYGLEAEYEEGRELEYLTQSELEEQFEEMLNESLDPVQFGALQYDAGTVFKQIDPVAFREDMNNYADSLLEDGYVIEGVNA